LTRRLLGLLRTEEGLAAEIIARRAGSPAAVRSTVLESFAAPPEANPPAGEGPYSLVR
jgi:hypothetical protein